MRARIASHFGTKAVNLSRSLQASKMSACEGQEVIKAAVKPFNQFEVKKICGSMLKAGQLKSNQKWHYEIAEGTPELILKQGTLKTISAFYGRSKL